MRRVWIGGGILAALVIAGAAAVLLRGQGSPAAPASSSSPVTTEATPGPPYVEAVGYPRPLLFRAGIEELGVRGAPLDTVVTLAAPYDLVIAKALDEEVLTLAKVAPYLREVKTRSPEKIVLDHFLLKGRNPAAQYPPVWPGHWLLLNGTTLTAPLGDGAADTVLVLADGAAVRAGEAIQVVALDASGRTDYARVEQMRVVRIDGTRATVERGTSGSSRQRFEAGRARVAAHAIVTYNETTGPIWDYNFCREAPRDPSGRRLIEALAQSLAEYLRPDAILGGLDGYQFDVAAFVTGGQAQGTRRIDCDDDGAPDSGYVGGVSSYGLGTVEFQHTLRDLVGERVLLISEATSYWSSRDIAYANGIENESFPDLHSWDNFSSAYQRYQYWLGSARQPRLSYLQLKETTEAFTRCPQQDAGTNWKYRLALGAALLGDGYFGYLSTNEFGSPQCNYIDTARNLRVAELDELFGGAERRAHYLGAPRGEPQRVDLVRDAANLLPNGGFEQDLAGATLVLDRRTAATLSRDTANPGEGSASLRVDIPRVLPDPQDTHVQVRLGTFRVVRGREYTLRFRVRAESANAAAGPLFADVAARVAFNLTVGGNVPTEQDVMADRTWRSYSLSFVAAADDAQANVFVLLGMEAGSIWLDSLRLQAGPGDTFARRFDHGVVLVNGSTEAAAFDLGALYPDMALRRLNGTQDPKVNTGEVARGVLTVPARDALILVAP